MDIGLNENFDLDFDDTNDLPTVTGQALFEQRLRTTVVSFFQTTIGETNRDNARELLELEASRVVDRFDQIVSVANIRTEYDEDEPNTIVLTITYDTGDNFDFNITE